MMTSAVLRPRRQAASPPVPSNVGMIAAAAQPAGRQRAGLTLMEICLTLALLGLLMGVVVINLPAWSQSRFLDEGSQQFVSMIYMAEADAANLGRKLRLDFAADAQGVVQVSLRWEPDPLAEPFRFRPYTACTWTSHIPAGLVEVASCRLTGSDAYRPELGADGERGGSSEKPLDSITFYPDGSCDSAEIELVSLAKKPDQRVALIDIEGLTGRVTRQILTPSQLAEREQQ